MSYAKFELLELIASILVFETAMKWFSNLLENDTTKADTNGQHAKFEIWTYSKYKEVLIGLSKQLSMKAVNKAWWTFLFEDAQINIHDEAFILQAVWRLLLQKQTNNYSYDHYIWRFQLWHISKIFRLFAIEIWMIYLLWKKFLFQIL